jgi:predicted dehydrogenase
MHWPSLFQLSDRFEVTALCDVSPVILEQLGKFWNVPTLTTDHRELVSSDNVDAVLVANPNAFHAEVTLGAVAAGKHVLVEKPMCVTRREAEQIIAAQENSDLAVQVGYMRRYAPAFLDGCEADCIPSSQIPAAVSILVRTGAEVMSPGGGPQYSVLTLTSVS